jgi:hypothetical protein
MELTRARHRHARIGMFVLVAVAATLLTAVASAVPVAAAPRPGCAGPVIAGFCAPRTVELDGWRLLVTRERIRFGDPALRAPLTGLLAQANQALTAGPWSVMDKTQVPPSGDRHDYLSQAPYWWPTQPKTADNPWGCPYVQRDGVRNPDADAITDHGARGAAFTAIYQLALAWYYTGNPAYAQRAERDLRTWFLDPATKMNPNLNHTQFVPCQVDGRGVGIIDFSEALPDVVDAVAILDSGAPAWTGTDHAGMTAWFSAFLTWLRTSRNGGDEAAAENNHGSFFDEQEAALAVYTGDTALARDIVLAAEHQRIDKQIRGDGGQPLELSRTRSFHYSVFNLMALTRLADVGRHVEVDLWSYRSPGGGTLAKAVDFLLPAATQGQRAWPYQELNFAASRAIDVIHAAADAGDGAAWRALPEVPAPSGGDLWPLRPAAEDMG